MDKKSFGPNATPTPPAPQVAPDRPDTNFMDGAIDQISNAGRNILKSIEEYKFKVDQVSRMLRNNPQASGLLEQKKKNLDQAANEIYQLVFSIENIDITNVANQVPNMQQPQNTPGQKSEAPNVGPTAPQGGAPSPQPGTPQGNTQTMKDQNTGMPNDTVR